MMRTRLLISITLLLLSALRAEAQELPFPQIAGSDDAHLAAALPALAKQALAEYRNDNKDRYLSAVFRMQLVAGDAAASVATADQWLAQHVYTIDPVAQLDTAALTYQWFDYVMKKGPKPAILKNKINYEVMGANEWRNAPSLEAMSNEKLTLHLSPVRSGDYYTLSAKQPAASAAVTQRVDFKDRTTTSFGPYPGVVLSGKPDFKEAQLFVSEPFDAPVAVNGLFSAQLRAILNEKDMDISMVLYEITPSGQFFHLSWTTQRASVAKDTTKRQLLVPNRPQTIPLDNTHLVSRQLSKGSRLLVALTINRSPYYQINYGTGKDVSDESIADAKEPLVVQWLGESTVTIPISR